MRTTLLTALACLVLPVHADSDRKAPPAKPIVVPFEILRSGHMAVQVRVNGKGPYKLIFDTGAPMSLVNNKVAKEAGLLEGVARPAFTLFGSMGEAKIKTLQVGDAKADDVPAVVMDHPTVELIGQRLGTPISGLIGYPFFARFRMTLDYQARTMTLVPNGYRPPDVLRAMMGSILGGNNRKVLAPSAQWGIEASKETGDTEAGIDIRAVLPGSSAERAGLKRGDRLLTLDGRWTDSLNDLYEAASFVKPGTPTVVKVRRGDKETDITVTPTTGL